MKGAFWLFAFVCSLILLAAAYYVTRPGMRVAVDKHAPWFGTHLQRYVRESAEPAPPAPSVAAPKETAPAPMLRPPGPPPAAPEPFDLKKLAANRASWPKKVALAIDKEFPAVVDGKVIGSLKALAGTEVDIVTISGGKIGVEYKGGGAWLFVEETDVIARTQAR